MLMMPPQMSPLTTATPSSFTKSWRALVTVICPRATARTIMVMVWLPELPPMPATMGISAASATSFSIEPSKAPITREAMKAVTRLIASQDQRLRKLFQTGANTSSSLDRPASASCFSSLLARM